jgi:putative peptide zinc metalloprotease protein
MNQQLLSPTWYRVSQLRPRLRSHIRIHRHVYRGERWYVVEDRISRRTHRFGPEAHLILGLMNGQRAMQEIWDAAAQRLGDGVPTQDEVIQLLSQLHTAELMQCEVSPDIDDLLARATRTAQRTRLAKFLSPLSVKIPLLDPDRLLERTLPWYRGLFGRWGAALWIAVVGVGLFRAVQHWNELTLDISDHVLSPENLFVMLFVFPLLKAAHEFGHACAVKAWGGEVHEMGVMLLVLMPVPYVDASAANAFPGKLRRMLVGSAGMAVELFLASIALFLWLEVQPGVLRAVLFNVMLIAGVSTVLFNANPLLRFDGYYILADLLEMPNLRQRAQQHLTAFAQRRLLGIRTVSNETGTREQAWLVFFQIASFVYRMTITIGIALFVATQYFVVGVILGIWALVSGILMPFLKLAGFIAFSPRLRRNRVRAGLVSVGVVAMVSVLLFVVPFPSWTNAQGVIWLPDQLAVRGGSDGFVSRVVVAPGSVVSRGQPLVEATDPMLPMRIQVLEGQRNELEARYQSERGERLVRAQMTADQLQSLAAELKRAHERAGELVMRSPADGVFAAATASDLPGRFVKKGETIGYVIPEATLLARVLVPQNSVDLVRGANRRVSVRLAEDVGSSIEAKVAREVPRASNRLPSLALARSGGGEVALDPQAAHEPKALQSYFEFELMLPYTKAVGLGGRVYVRFDHEPEPLGHQAWRSVRQLFLDRFAV